MFFLQGGELVEMSRQVDPLQLDLQKKRFSAPLLVSKADSKSQESSPRGGNSLASPSDPHPTSSVNQKSKVKSTPSPAASPNQATKTAESGISSPSSDKGDRNQSAKSPRQQTAENSQQNQNPANIIKKQEGKVKRELSKAESLKCEEFQRSEFERGYIEFSLPCSNSLFCFTSSEILRNYCEDDSRLVRYLCDPEQRNGWTTEVIPCPELCKSGKCSGS